LRKKNLTLADFIPGWANAIAQFEGFNSPGSRAARNHNPGDLKFAGQPGAAGRDSLGFAVFPDDATGWQALYRQLQKYVSDFPNDSLLDIMAHYLGQISPTSNVEGNAFTYAGYVASSLGVDISSTLGELAGLVVPAVGAGVAALDADSMIPGMMADDTQAQPSGASLLTIALAAGLIWLAVRSWG
jgi:hypothetical protein